MSAVKKRPAKRTASLCTAAEADRATHSFKIVGENLHNGFGVGNSVSSATFTVGGYDWGILYYPDGYSEQDKDYVGAFLELRTKDADVHAHYDLRLVNAATGASTSICRYQKHFHKGAFSTWGRSTFFKKSELQARGYLRDDILEIDCDVTVTRVNDAGVPPSDLPDHFGRLLKREEGKDVAFIVKDEVFHAHKIVLAARSPVFNAQLYGSMSDHETNSILVQDMQPPVFKALLHFIYTDSLPGAVDDLDVNKNDDMIRHLLVAADRYALERMKFICEDILCNRLDIENVTSNFALADQHHCSKLKDVCIQFINTSNRMDDVVASQGYQHLKRTCPDLTIEIWEKSSKPRKI